MDIDRFWELIQQARTAAGPAADQAVRDYDNPDDDPDRDYWDFDDIELDPDLVLRSPDGAALEEGLAEDDEDDLDDEEDEEDELTDPVATALLSVLEQLPAAEIAAFDKTFERLRDVAERDDLANAAVLIEHGFLGDDSFDDFRAGLVALGRGTYEGALGNPDTLADHPLVREIAQANDPRWLGREDMLYVASRAYATVTGEDEVTFFDYVESLYPEGSEEDLPYDESDADWAVTDEAQTRERLPRLSELFYERSMSNRSRAMEKLGLKD